MHRPATTAGGDQGHYLMGMDEHSSSVIRPPSAPAVTPREWVDASRPTTSPTTGAARVQYTTGLDPHNGGSAPGRSVVARCERIQTQLASRDLYVADYEGVYLHGVEEFKQRPRS